jgi:hypothetical protein
MGNRTLTIVILLVGAAVLGITLWVVSVKHAELSTVDAAAIIAVTAAAAVGIERVIELLWTVVGQLGNTWWPMRLASESLGEVQTEVNAKLAPFFAAARRRAQGIGAGVDELDKDVKTISDLVKGARTSQDLRVVSAKAAASIDYWQARLTPAANYADSAHAAFDGVTEFLETFTDNPFRRIISLFGGMVLGLIVAATVGLDCINAALAPVSEGGQGPVSPTVWGMILTGLLIGLGANPTHEVVKALQEYKQSKRTTQASAGSRSASP